MIRPSIIPVVLSNFRVAVAHALVGAMTHTAVVVVAVFGHETNQLTFEQSANPKTT